MPFTRFSQLQLRALCPTASKMLAISISAGRLFVFCRNIQYISSALRWSFRHISKWSLSGPMASQSLAGLPIDQLDSHQRCSTEIILAQQTEAGIVPTCKAATTILLSHLPRVTALYSPRPTSGTIRSRDAEPISRAAYHTVVRVWCLLSWMLLSVSLSLSGQPPSRTVIPGTQTGSATSTPVALHSSISYEVVELYSRYSGISCCQKAWQFSLA